LLCSLPRSIQATEEAELIEMSDSLQFQMEWELRFFELWQELTDSEREMITPIQPPYTEQQVSEFLQILKNTKEQRSVLNTIVSFLPDWTPDKKLPVSVLREGLLIQRLRSNEHPFIWMKEIPTGYFLMGAFEENEKASEYEYPQHRVRIQRPFAIGKYPVTEGVWSLVQEQRPLDSQVPVTNVHWFDCVLFCNKLSELEGLQKAYTISNHSVHCDFDSEGYRLPTEAEWEKAARGGDFYLYSGSNNVDEVAWCGDQEGSVRRVGKKQPNSYGLYDMSGNVYEWCWNWYGKYDDYLESDENIVQPLVEDPTGPENGRFRVLRGGSFFDGSFRSRVTFRYGDETRSRTQQNGFRLCRTLSYR